RDGMPVVRSDKDDRRYRLISFVQPISKLNTRELRHLDIEKDYVVLLFLHHVEGLDSVDCCIQRIDIAPAAQRLLQSASRERLVIHDQHPHDCLLVSYGAAAGELCCLSWGKK